MPIASKKLRLVQWAVGSGQREPFPGRPHPTQTGPEVGQLYRTASKLRNKWLTLRINLLVWYSNTVPIYPSEATVMKMVWKKVTSLFLYTYFFVFIHIVHPWTTIYEMICTSNMSPHLDHRAHTAPWRLLACWLQTSWHVLKVATRKWLWLDNLEQHCQHFRPSLAHPRVCVHI